MKRRLRTALSVLPWVVLAACRQAPAPQTPTRLDLFFTANVGGEIEPCG